MAEGINLALLPDLNVIKPVNTEEILAGYVSHARLENASPNDPAFRTLLAGAYREMLLRQDMNEQAKGLMLAYATGPELDHLGVTYYHHANGSPVVRLPGELDDYYRTRMQISLEGLSSAGPDGFYIFLAKSADDNVKAVAILSPSPCVVDIYILSHTNNGMASSHLIEVTDDYVQHRRALTDNVIIHCS